MRRLAPLWPDRLRAAVDVRPGRESLRERDNAVAGFTGNPPTHRHPAEAYETRHAAHAADEVRTRAGDDDAVGAPLPIRDGDLPHIGEPYSWVWRLWDCVVTGDCG